MKRLLIIICIVLTLPNISFVRTEDAVDEIREFARRRHPRDSSMQEYVFNRQLEAFRYLEDQTDEKLKEIATRNYPADYVMQKHTYNTQLESKMFMDKVKDKDAKSIAVSRYPNNYEMQQVSYNSVIDSKAKGKKVVTIQRKKRGNK